MPSAKQEVIGGEKDFWLHSEADGFDLTHPPTPTSPPIYPRIVLETTTEPITIDPHKTALVVVDLQNYFLSPCMGRPSDAVGLKAVDKLLRYAIPACRAAGIPIMWLAWGLTEEDIEGMPPTIIRGFGLDRNFDGQRRVKGLGSEVGSVKLDDGSVVDGGRVLVRDQWNSESYSPLREKYQPQDMVVLENRLSGFWGGTTCEEPLASRGIRTLMFAGANTD